MHWVRPELVVDVKYLTWTEDNLLKQVVYEGVREDKPATKADSCRPTTPAVHCMRQLDYRAGLSGRYASHHLLRFAIGSSR